MSTRTTHKQRQERARTGASTPKEWRDLCLKALAAAEAIQDPRAQGLRAALESRREQASLRAMSIICENDISREFSARTS